MKKWIILVMSISFLTGFPFISSAQDLLLRVTVRDMQNQPLNGASVMVSPEGGEGIPERRFANEEGLVTFHLEENGMYRIRAMYRQAGADPGPPLEGSKTIELNADEPERNITMRLH